MKPSSRAGGFTFAENGARSFTDAQPIWSAAFDPTVVTASATPSPAPSGVDLLALGERRWVAVDPDGRQHLAIICRDRHVRMDIVAGSVLHGPVALEFRLPGLTGIVPKLEAIYILLRLAGVRGASTRSPDPDRRLPRLVEALRVLDGLTAGASLRTIATELRGQIDVSAAWSGASDYLRSQVRRRAALARMLAATGAAGILAHKI